MACLIFFCSSEISCLFKLKLCIFSSIILCIWSLDHIFIVSRFIFSCFILVFKGTVGVNSSDPTWKEGNARFPTEPFKPSTVHHVKRALCTVRPQPSWCATCVWLDITEYLTFKQFPKTRMTVFIFCQVQKVKVKFFKPKTTCKWSVQQLNPRFCRLIRISPTLLISPSGPRF